MATKIPLPTVAALAADASTRTRILTAGVEVLHSDGLVALTQQAVAEKAGVRQSHITYYFPTRLDLLQATAQFGAECMIAPISTAAMSGNLSFDEFRELLMPDVNDRNWWRLMTAMVNACAESENIRGWIKQFDDQICVRLREGFSAFGIELTSFEIQVLHATYIGAVTLDMQEMTDRSQLLARQILSEAIDLIVAKSRGALNDFADSRHGVQAHVAPPSIPSPLPPPPPPRDRLSANRKVSRAGTTSKAKLK